MKKGHKWPMTTQPSAGRLFDFIPGKVKVSDKMQYCIQQMLLHLTNIKLPYPIMKTK